VSVERIFYCDAEDCEGHVRTAAKHPGPGWVRVTEDGSSRSLTFCTWDCVLKYAAKQEPVETIPFEPGEAPS
jgi:hypothetical protein